MIKLVGFKSKAVSPGKSEQGKGRRFSSVLSPQSSVLKIGLLAGSLVIWLALPLVASAHPLGNFTVNKYSRLEIGAAGVKVHYVLDVAEIPTFQEKDTIDQNRDGQISEAERLAYLERKTKELQGGLKLSLDGVPTALKLVGQDLSFPAGQGGLTTMRLTATFETAALGANATRLSYQDENYSDRLGWREIVVRNATGVALLNSSAPATDQSNELRVYPEDMLASPLALTSAQASFKLDASMVVNNATSEAGSVVKTQDPLAALVTGELTPLLVLIALGGALVLGAVHALSPGHGKTVVAAYLIGTRGTARHAMFLGLTVTVTHTIGVFALGLITLFASQFILPEKLYPWLGLISGLIVLGMGVTLLRSRVRSALVSTSASKSEHTRVGHEHSHDHDHTHDEPSHNHDNEHSHEHEFAYAQAGQANVGIANKAAPSAPAIHVPQVHDHEHHEHSHADHEHSHDQEHEHNHADHEHSHDQEQAYSHADHEHVQEDGMHVHSHGGKAHSHLPPGANGTTLTWKRLLLFGISAGLLPCPSALVLMLSAIALNRTALGLIMIVVFSLGLAATLTGMGLLFVYARKLMAGRQMGRANWLLKVAPIAGALVVAVVGIVISYQGLIQTGILKN